MSAKLEIKRSIVPPGLWHWVIIVDNQAYKISTESYEFADECIANALYQAADVLAGADLL